MSDYFGGKEVNMQLSSDEAMAIGAAIYAGIEKGSHGMADISIVDVLPVAIGISIVDRERRA